MARRIRYEANVCGGDFQSVKQHFNVWKKQPLVYRPNQHMFAGKHEVRMLSEQIYDNSEIARKALQHACKPEDPFALAVNVDDGERDIWIVMAAYHS
jgi:hypothetical protein